MTKRKKGIVEKVFNYLEPIWTNREGKVSLRSLLSIFLTWKLIENFDYGVQKWDAGRDLGDLATSLLTLAGLIAALLGITAYQNVQIERVNAEVEGPKIPAGDTQDENFESTKPKRMGTGG